MVPLCAIQPVPAESTATSADCAWQRVAHVRGSMSVAPCRRHPSSGVFANNAASELLRGGQPHSMKDMVRPGLSLRGG